LQCATIAQVNEGATEEQAAVGFLAEATAALVGVAARAVERVKDEVSPAEFRLLLAVATIGPAASATVAAHLGVARSSVTRLGDRLELSGHLRRRRGRPNRSVVRLELTDRGQELVGRVVARRREELAGIVGRLPEGAAGQVAAALAMVVDAAAAGGPAVEAGPIELRVR
jgi:DNA-binding MarR family transcriptional regulator